MKIVGAAMTRFGKFPDATFSGMATEAAFGALDDAGVDARQVGFVAFANAAAGVVTGQEMIRAQIALGRTPLAGTAMLDVENACASASSAAHVGWMAVASGAYDVVLVIGVEKMTHGDKRRAFAALSRAVDVEALVATHGERVLVEGAGPLFMEIYAAEARAYMERSGATVDDFAAVAAKNFQHGSLNPKSQYATPYSCDDVLTSRVVIDPLRLLMCSPIADGAAALVLCSEDYARVRRLPGVDIAASVLRSGRTEGAHDLVERAAAAAYDAAALGPADLDVIEVHDAASPAELIVSEQLGLAPAGDGPALLRSGATRLGGRVPVNPSGGLVSKGHPIGATGCAQLVELYDQLRGRCGSRQVAGARVGLAENGGGWLGEEGAACAITILRGEETADERAEAWPGPKRPKGGGYVSD